MKTSRFVAAQDPAGLWKYSQLLGATVHIKSRSIQSGFFAFDSESTYTIENIGFRMTQTGISYAVVKLKGLSQEFSWKDLEVVGLNYCTYSIAICGNFCCGQTLCGRFVDSVVDTNNQTEEVVEDDYICTHCQQNPESCDCEGDVLD
jgi:hypothetical protein